MKRRSFLKSTLLALTLLYRGPMSTPTVEDFDDEEGFVSETVVLENDNLIKIFTVTPEDCPLILRGRDQAPPGTGRTSVSRRWKI